MDLETYLEDGALLTDELIQFIERQVPTNVPGEAMQRLSECYRGLGIYEYLINFDTAALLQGLIQSALTRKFYLRAAKENVEDDPWRRCSLCDSFFDAIVAGQIELAREIASLSAMAHMPGFEYEDDYLYARILYDWVTSGRSGAQYDAALRRFESVLDGASSPRLDATRALIEGDAEAFKSAFEELLRERVDRMTELANPEKGHAAAQAWTFEANRRIFVEGEALLRLGQLANFDLNDEYLLCPRIVFPKDYRFVPESFPMTPL